MTNVERWKTYTSGLSSPNNFIDWSYRYLISASLQRRVWMGPSDGLRPDNQACFPNLYITLVGPPGVGKGLCIKEVSLFLKHWKLKDAVKLKLENATPEQQQTQEAVREMDLKNASQSELQPSNKQARIPESLLIPIAADATTYEALVEAVGYSYRRINFIDNNNGSPKLEIYGHSSSCFVLQELGSLLRKRTDDTVTYLLGLYDCPIDFQYATKTNGKDRVKCGCLNLLAGTTPGFMQRIFHEELVNEGFSSRMFFIFAAKNRKSQFWIPDLSIEQKQYRTELLEHIKKLTCLFGKIKVEPETDRFLEEWWQKYDNEPKLNKSAKMLPYYARKNIHVMKVAMVEHFSESTEMFIPKSTFERAIDILAEEEKKMHLAIMMEESNPTSRLSKKLLEFLANGSKNWVEILVALFDSGDEKTIRDALSFLEETDQIEPTQTIDKQTEKSTIHWKIKERKE